MSQIFYIFEFKKTFTFWIASIDDLIVNDKFEHFFPPLELELFQGTGKVFFDCLNCRTHQISFKLDKLV